MSQTMTFAQCLEKLLLGKKCRRAAWEEDGTHIMMVDQQLMIWKLETKQYHPLIVSTQDMIAEDWVVVERVVEMS